MEEVLNTMRATQAKKNALGKSRAMEMQMKSPQLMDSTLLEPTTDDVIHGKGSGGEAGMKRVIGSGKRGRPPKMDGASNGVMKSEDMSGGFLGALASLAVPLIGKLFGNGQMTEKARNDLLKLLDGKKSMKGGAAPISSAPSGLQVSHATMSPAQQGLAGQALGGQDVPPGGVAPVAYGSVPQAPASFQRNTVGMGKAAGAGKNKMACGGAMPTHRMPDGTIMPGAKHGGVVSKKGREDEKLGMEIAMIKKKMKGSAPPAGAGAPCMTCKGGAPPAGAGKKSTARGQAIAKLMKEKGMTLGQASKFLKENA
jgi:hypothetical protein